MRDVLQIIAALGLLTLGAECLIRGASRLARLAGVSPLVVGLTVVALGTSAPEVTVSVKAALADQADIAIGNVIGSNIFNILFILGISAVVAPLTVSRKLVRIDIPVMIAVSVIAWILAMNRSLGRWEGLGLLVVCIVYTTLLIRSGLAKGDHRETPGHLASEHERSVRNVAGSALRVALGLALLVVGGRWFVDGAIIVARSWGVSELMIGLTVVAAGTSLPEVATSVIATIKGERDIAIGNVVGSNIYNLLAILGATSVLADGIPVSAASLRFDLPVMVAVAFSCLPIAMTGGRVSRWEGLLFLSYYVAYVVFVALADSEHLALPAFSAIMMGFVLPATALGLGLSLYYSFRVSRGRDEPPV